MTTPNETRARERFVGWIADRFQERHATPLSREQAEDMGANCLNAVEEMGLVFGTPDYDWGCGGAQDLADEEIYASWESVA